MSNEPNKPTEAQELTEKELEGVVGGLRRKQEMRKFVIAGGAMMAFEGEGQSR